jgi:Rieske Fe-S protein
MTETTRRAVIFGAGGAGLAAALTACAGYGTGSTDAAAPPAQPADGAAGGATEQAPKADSAAAGIAKTSDIPEGGGKILEGRQIVITQPAAGEFKAFSAICTHQGCSVDNVSNGTINCPCHGSRFNIKDGSVANGPATAPLPEKKIKVSGSDITLA